MVLLLLSALSDAPSRVGSRGVTVRTSSFFSIGIPRRLLRIFWAVSNAGTSFIHHSKAGNTGSNFCVRRTLADEDDQSKTTFEHRAIVFKIDCAIARQAMHWRTGRGFDPRQHTETFLCFFFFLPKDGKCLIRCLMKNVCPFNYNVCRTCSRSCIFRLCRFTCCNFWSA